MPEELKGYSVKGQFRRQFFFFLLLLNFFPVIEGYCGIKRVHSRILARFVQKYDICKGLIVCVIRA